MDKINLDVVYNDFMVELNERNLTYFPHVVVKSSSYVALREFDFDMASSVFLKFLTRFCDERNLNWFVNFDSHSILIG